MSNVIIHQQQKFTLSKIVNIHKYLIQVNKHLEE